jgi:hypothetical protein
MRTEAQAIVPADTQGCTHAANDLWQHAQSMSNCYLQSQRLLLDIGTELLEAYKVPGQFVQVRRSSSPVHTQGMVLSY